MRRKLTLFGFLVMVYDRVGNRDKIPKENFSFGRPRFYATNYLKLKLKYFSRKR